MKTTQGTNMWEYRNVGSYIPFNYLDNFIFCMASTEYFTENVVLSH